MISSISWVMSEPFSFVSLRDCRREWMMITQISESRKTHYLICLFSDTEVDVVLTAEEFGRIDGRFMHQHFVVQMRSCSSASHAHAADNLALSHFLSLDHEDSPQVAIFGGHSRPVVNQNLIAVSGFSGAGMQNNPIGRGADRSAGGSGNIHAGMECAFAAERIHTLAKT